MKVPLGFCPQDCFQTQANTFRLSFSHPLGPLLHPSRGRGQRSRLAGGIGERREGERFKQSLGEPFFLQAPGLGCPPSLWLDTWLQTSPSHLHLVGVMGREGWSQAGWTLGLG